MSDINEELFNAVAEGDLIRAEAALNRGASAGHVRSTVGDCWTHMTPLLFTACEKQHLPIIRLLLLHGADANAEFTIRSPVWGYESKPCLFANLQSAEVVRILLEHKANPNGVFEAREDCLVTYSALSIASGDEEVCALLRNFGAVQ
jgi:hypothetical protein